MKPKIRVCVPVANNGVIATKTRDSLKRLKEHQGFDVCIDYVYGSDISGNRNAGVNDATSNEIKQFGFDFDYYLAVDSDIEFECWHLVQLLQHKKHIVGGAYKYHVDRSKIVAGNYNAHGIVSVDSFLGCNDTGLTQVKWIGMGFTLIAREVFEKVNYPWFHTKVVYYGDKMQYACIVGEDVGFCQNAVNNGFEIYCDCDCKINHLESIGEQMDIQAVKAEHAKISVEYQKATTQLQEAQSKLQTLSKQIEALTLYCVDLKGQITFADKLLKQEDNNGSTPIPEDGLVINQ